jgi:hypothetical protein
MTTRAAARPHQAALLGILNIVSAIPIVVLAFGVPSALVYPLVAIEGATVIVSDVVFLTMLQRPVGGEVLGRVFGIMDSIMVAGIMVGTILGPVLVGAFGLRPAMITAGLLVFVITGLALPKARAVDRTAAARTAELAELVRALERVDIFEGASRPTLEALADATTTESVAAGTIVIREGEPADDLFVIADGAMSVTSEGRELEGLATGDHFGEIGVIERRPRTATVVALVDSDLYRIRGDDFIRAVSEAPRLSGRFASSVTTRLRRTHHEALPG